MKLTASQAAKLAGVSRSLIYQLCEERRIPHLRLGTKGRRGRILIEEADLIEFLERCRVEPEAPRPTHAPASPSSVFKNLDSDRLLEAWKRRGAISSPQDGHSSP
jgi:excisionase family DNA binding protein